MDQIDFLNSVCSVFTRTEADSCVVEVTAPSLHVLQLKLREGGKLNISFLETLAHTAYWPVTCEFYGCELNERNQDVIAVINLLEKAASFIKDPIYAKGAKAYLESCSKSLKHLLDTCKDMSYPVNKLLLREGGVKPHVDLNDSYKLIWQGPNQVKAYFVRDTQDRKDLSTTVWALDQALDGFFNT